MKFRHSVPPMPAPPDDRLKRRGPAPMALEARVMFDGAAVDAALTALTALPSERPVADIAGAGVAAVNSEGPVVPPALETEPRVVGGHRELVAVQPERNGGRREVAFIDAEISDWQSVANGVRTGVAVVLLDAGMDGVRQLADYLQGHRDLDAIHVYAHGEPGAVTLGSVRLDSDALAGRQADLATIGDSLTPTGDLLLYGCAVGQGAAGIRFLQQVALSTGADVAASYDATGGAAAGGNWTLETTQGQVETAEMAATAYRELLGTPVITDLDDRRMPEDGVVRVIDGNLTISGGNDYVGGSLRFNVSSGGASDVLSLLSSPTPQASGAISFEQGTVYQGNGSGRVAIGVVDPLENGQAGKALKIVFYKGFTNGGFETGDTTGWTPQHATYPLSLNGQPIRYAFSSGTQTGTGQVGIQPASTTLGMASITVVGTGAASGSHALELSSDGSVPTTGANQVNGNYSLHGPYVTSAAFTGFAGQQMALDWKAQGGSDAYEVFGYLLAAGTDGQFGTADDVRTQLFAQRGDSQPWTTETLTFTQNGLYRFEFLCGSYDLSGGGAVGANLYVDNIRLLTPVPIIDDATVTAIGRQVTYAFDTQAPGSVRTLTVTATGAAGGSGSAQADLTVGNVNDAPVLSAGPEAVYTENNGNVPVLIAPGLTLSDDLVGGHLGGATLTVDLLNGQAGDQLTLRNQGVGNGLVGYAVDQSMGAVTYDGLAVGILSSSNDGKRLSISFSSSVPPVVMPAHVTRAAVEAVLRNLQFLNATADPGAGNREIRIRLDDGGGTANGGSAVAEVDYRVRVVTVNDAPADIALGTTVTGSAWGSTNVVAGHHLVSGLGRPTNPGSNTDGRYSAADFGEIVITQGDDGFDSVDVSDIFPNGLNYCGVTYSGSQFFVGWNGYVTLGQGMRSFTPSGISQSSVPIIAPMFSDFDTRGGKSVADWNSDGGQSTGSNRIYVDKDLANRVVTITYDDVGQFASDNRVANAFQIRLWAKSGGDFDIEFRYENVGWAQRSGAWTSAGWSAGDRVNYSEISGSMTAEMANLSAKSNIGQAGVFLWQVRGGGVRSAGVAVTENSAPGTVVTPIAVADADDSQFTYQLKRPDGTYADSDGRFSVVREAGGGWVLQVAPGAVFDYEAASTQLVTLKVTDSGGGEGAGHELSYEKTFSIPVLDVNETPTDITLSATRIPENSAGGTVVGVLGSADPDAGDRHTYTVVGGASDKFMVANGRLVVRPGATLDFETAGSHRVVIRSTDRSGLFVEEAFTIQVDNLYEPVWFNPGPVWATYTENGAPVVVDSAIRVAAEGGVLPNGYLQVALHGNGQSTDRLSILPSGAQQIALSGTTVLYAGTVIGTLDAAENGQGGQPLRIRLNAGATAAGVQALARSIGFSSGSEAPSTATRGLQFTLSDGRSIATKAASVAVVAVNDAPEASLPGWLQTERTNLDPSATTSIRGLSVSDADEQGMLTAVLASRDLGGSRYGSLTVNTGIAGGLGPDGVADNGSGVVTLRGTPAQINATLQASDGVSYTPGAGRDSVETGNDRLTLRVTDSGGLVTVRSSDILVIPGIPTAHSQNYVTAEDFARDVVVDLSILVTDLNLTNAQYTLGKLAAGNAGTLTAFGAQQEIRDNGGSLLGFRLDHGQLLLQPGTVVNQGRFTYRPDPDWNGVESFNYVFQNSQQSSEIAHIRLFVGPENDAPVVVSAPTLSGDLRGDGSLRQRGSYAAEGRWHDVDNSADELRYRYQWQMADDASGTNTRDLDGATAARYTTNGTEIGKYLRVQVIASDGNLSAAPAFSAFTQVTNADPVAVGAPVLPGATESVPYRFTLPAGTFNDPDGDLLRYAATRSDGSPLPGWLAFDANTLTLFGTPTGRDLGDLTIRVSANDGGYRPASVDVVLRVTGVPPLPAGPVSAATLAGGASIPPVIQPGAPTGSAVSADTASGWPTGLPGDLAFRPAASAGHLSGSFARASEPGIPGYNPPGTVMPAGPAVSGREGQAAGGTTGLPPPLPEKGQGAMPGSERSAAPASGSLGAAAARAAGAEGGLTRPEGFQIAVQRGAGDAAYALQPGRALAGQGTLAAKAFEVAIPPDAFVHTSPEAVIALAATLPDGGTLPPWLSFDARKGVLRGVPPADVDGELELVITARDQAGNLATQRLRIRIGDGAVGKVSFAEQLRGSGSHARHAERMQLVQASRAAVQAPRGA